MSAADVLSASKPSENGRAAAESMKDSANEAFKKKDYMTAIFEYSSAIELDPTVATYYGNRSFAYIKTEMYGAALTDANQALELDNNYLKAYYRRASANMALGKFRLALKDFESVTKAKPSDKDAKVKYQECNKIVKRQAFEKAIAVEQNTVCFSELVEKSLPSIVVESDYEGPHLEDGQVTADFMESLLATFKAQKKLHKKYAYQILLQVKTIVSSQPSMVDIDVPVGSKFTVCGDIHGQFYDLLNIFELNGLPSADNPYLFNGDFVDRGSFSVECILVLFGFKLLYPTRFYLSRGNHESENMNKMYGFDGEVRAKFPGNMLDLFTEVFNWLPLCHLIAGKVLVMHGGLFEKDEVTLDDLRAIDRNRQPPESGLMCDLLWSDPQPQNGRSPSKRGVGCQFGPDITNRFLELNDLSYVIRSHEVKNDGYEEAHDGKCITVFSAPNYCDTMGNKGAFIHLIGAELKPKFITYEAVPHPAVRPMAYANPLLSMLS